MKYICNYNSHEEFLNGIPTDKDNIILCRAPNIDDWHMHWNCSLFDKRVEYLQNTGTQWIDTLYKHNGNTRFVCKLNLSGDLSAWRYPFGSYGNSKGTNKLFCLEINGSQKLSTYYGTANSGNNTAHNFNITPSGTHTFDLNKNVHKIDNTTYSFSYSNYTSLYNTLLFGVTNYSGGIQICPSTIKMYYFQIYDNGILVRDLIPVRKGSVGYMYDKVSGELYGNDGSGEFICGPDLE